MKVCCGYQRRTSSFRVETSSERRRFGCGGADGALTAALQQSAFAVMLTVPVVKGVEEFGRLLNGDDRPFGEDVELGVGDEGSDFEDVVALAVEAGHFEVNPDEVIGVLHS